MIISFSLRYRYYLYDGKTDMRKGYDGLSGLVREEFRQDPLSGDVFIFLNRYRNRIKLLQWQEDGFVIYCKRLEKGTFELPKSTSNHASMVITSSQIQYIMEGVMLTSIKKRLRYQLIVNKKVA